MDEAQIKLVAKETAKETVKEAIPEILENIGFDISNPTEVQKDIQHLAKSRALCDLIQKRVVVATISMGCGAIVIVLGLGIFELIEQKIWG